MTGHFVCVLFKPTGFFQKCCLLACLSAFFYVRRCCSLKADIFKSFVSSKVNTPIKDSAAGATDFEAFTDFIVMAQ